jgi:hypothetical protein
VKRAVHLALAIASLGSLGPVFPAARQQSDEQQLGTNDPALIVPPKQRSPDTVETSSGGALSIRESNQVLVPVSQVSAAYSLDPLVAEAQIEENHVRIWARSPGQAVIVLVRTKDFTTTTMRVIVLQAPPILPETVWNGIGSESQNDKGYYEVRVSSDPLQINDAFEYRTSGMQLHVTNVFVPGLNLPGSSSVRFPFSYLRLLGEGWKMTLLDDDIESSPISVSSTLLRGAHFSTGGLTIHAGYTSVAGFQSLFLPAYKQLIFGSTFAHQLNQNSQIGVTGYFLQRNPLVSDRRTAQQLATVFFKRHTQQRLDFSAEVGISKGIGAAISAAHYSDRDEFYLAARYRPRFYAASVTDNLNGLQSEVRWNHAFSEHLVSALSDSANDIFTRAGTQAIDVATENLRYKAFNGISFTSGVSLSRFSDQHTHLPDILRFALPLTISYDRSRFGMGAEYEYSQTSRAFSPGQAYRGSVRWSGQHFQMNAGGGIGTQSLGTDSVYSTFPGLTVRLAQLGIGTSTSVEQLAAFLRDRAFLNRLGISPGATLQLIPRNGQANLDLSWRSGRQVVELDSNYNLQSFLAQRSTTVLQTVRYRRGLTNATELVTSLTLFDTIARVSRRDVVWEFGVRHQLGDGAFWKRHVQKGVISGTVRLQDVAGERPVQASEIKLDRDRRTRSDSQGHYSFRNVSYGVHTVQIAYQSERPFWYTTPSKAQAGADSIVNFGIMCPSAQLIGYVLNDGGVGLADIGMLVKGPQGELNVTTDQAGKFVIPVAQSGSYVVQVNAETVPDGYALEEMQRVNVSVAGGEFKKISFTLTAIRAVVGSVRAYDSAKGNYVPVTGVTMELAELHKQAITDRNGRYSFRNMPPGIWTILVNGKQFGQLQLNVGPQLLRRDINLSGRSLAIAPQ